jgi:hypothetical protein
LQLNPMIVQRRRQRRRRQQRHAVTVVAACCHRSCVPALCVVEVRVVFIASIAERFLMTIKAELEAQILRYYLTFLIMSGDTVELPRPSEDCGLQRRRAQSITRHSFLCPTKPKSWFADW